MRAFEDIFGIPEASALSNHGQTLLSVSAAGTRKCQRLHPARALPTLGRARWYPRQGKALVPPVSQRYLTLHSIRACEVPGDSSPALPVQKVA